MKRYEMVKSHEEFNEIINKGNRLKGKYAYIFSKEKEFDKPNFGIAVGKKLGNAVVRINLNDNLEILLIKTDFSLKITIIIL